MNYTGEAWVKAGRMVELNMTCDGSGPWNACWLLVPVPYNVTGDEVCNPDDIRILKHQCNFPVNWWFSNSGMHNILTIGKYDFFLISSRVTRWN